MTLSEAFQNIDFPLIPGRVYNFEAGGCQIELRVRDAKAPTQPMDLESDTMLDAWTEFPFKGQGTLHSRPANKPDWPDPPILPIDDEQ